MEHADTVLQVNRLIHYGLQKKLVLPKDRVYATNRLLAKLQLEDFRERPVTEALPYPQEILTRLCDYAVAQSLISDTAQQRDRFDTELMDCLLPRPSEVTAEFYRLYASNPSLATDYYYDFSQSSNYIRMDRIEKDLLWHSSTRYGDLVITINRSKPEKDPRDIAAAKNAKASGYPKCPLCRENEGFWGSATQAARGNHRLIPVTLDGDPWYIQYSPYVYYNEHLIVLHQEHRPMSVSVGSMKKLLDFLGLFPHYFVGSNADLPIVGGSILSHDHFQGGRYEFPMAKAPLRQRIRIPGFEDLTLGMVDWPLSTLRITGKDPGRILDLAEITLDRWRNHSHEALGIFARTGDEPHNTITPIARRRGEAFQLDLVLRNNRTSPEHPLGIFHPHKEYHHIKQENIGLIEVMGLAILPPRLETEMADLAQALLDPAAASDILAQPHMEKHRDWYQTLRKQMAGLQPAANGEGSGQTQGPASSPSPKEVKQLLEDSVGEIFMHILENAGVYKNDPAGTAGFLRFCESLGV